MGTSRRKAWRWSAVVLALGVVVPVGSGIAAATKAGAFPATLVGTWTRNVTQVNKNAAGERDFPFPVVGVWTMVITNGRIAFYDPGSYLPGCKTCSSHVSSPSTVAGARLTFAEGPAAQDPAYRGCWPKGVYGWTVSGRALTLRAIADTCGSRKALLVGVWKRK